MVWASSLGLFLPLGWNQLEAAIDLIGSKDYIASGEAQTATFRGTKKGRMEISGR